MVLMTTHTHMSESEDDKDVESWVIMVRWERVAGMVGGTLVRPGTTLQLTWPALLSVLSLRVSDTSRDTLPPPRPDQSSTDDTPGHTSDILAQWHYSSKHDWR